jgi:hypothetical protein
MTSALLLGVFLAAGPKAGAGDACALFKEGAKLVELHIYEAEGGRREGVLEGIQKLRSSLKGGCSRIAEAHRLIGDAAWVFASQHARGGEGPEYAALAIESYREYVRMRPNDSSARFTFAAVMLGGRPEGVAQLEELVRRHPDHAMGRFSLGTALIARGRDDEGTAQLAEAARMFRPEEAEAHGDDLVRLLKAHGRSMDADRASKEIRAKVERLPHRGK